MIFADNSQKLFQCLDKLEQSDRFHIHANELYSRYNYTTTIDDKIISYGDIIDELNDSKYNDSIKSEKFIPSSRQQKLVNARKKWDEHLSTEIYKLTKNTKIFDDDELDSIVVQSR